MARYTGPSLYMSGGHFDYDQYRIKSIIQGIEREIDNPDHSPTVNAIFHRAIRVLRAAFKYSDCIDRYLSWDDSEQTMCEEIKSIALGVYKITGDGPLHSSVYEATVIANSPEDAVSILNAHFGGECLSNRSDLKIEFICPADSPGIAAILKICH